MLHANNQNCLYKLKAPTGINVTVILHRVILDCSDSLTITIPTLRNNFGELLLKCQRNSRRAGGGEGETTRKITTFDGEIIIQFVSDFQDTAQGFLIEYALVEMLNSRVLYFFLHFLMRLKSVQLADLVDGSSNI